MCFGHVVDLSSGRVIQQVDPKAPKAGYDTEDDFDDDATSNPIALARSVVGVIRASGQRREAFNDLITNGNEKGWFQQGDPPESVKIRHRQLLRDVQTRWDSVYHMLERLRLMRPVRLDFLLNAC